MASRDDITLTIAIVGAVFGLIGTALSVFNTWRAVRRDRVNLRVTPMRADGMGRASGSEYLVIEVVNLSTFPVTISQIGFRKLLDDRRLAILIPITIDGGSWPRRLEPRTSVSTYTPLANFSIDDLADLRCAYAITECGVEVEGKSPVLLEYALMAATHLALKD